MAWTPHDLLACNITTPIGTKPVHAHKRSSQTKRIKDRELKAHNSVGKALKAFSN